MRRTFPVHSPMTDSSVHIHDLSSHQHCLASFFLTLYPHLPPCVFLHSRCHGVSPAPRSTHLTRLITATGLCPARHAPLSPPPWRLKALAAAPRSPPPPDPVPLASSPPRVGAAPAPPLCRGGGTAAPLPAAHTPTGDGRDGFPPPQPALDRPHPWRHRPCGRCHRHRPHPPLPPPTSNSSRWPLCPSRRGG